MASLSVWVSDGVGGWTQVDADKATVARKAGASEAVFQVSDATVAERRQLRHGYEVRIQIDDPKPGQGPLRFLGYLEKIKILVDAPKHFNVEAICVGCEQGASLKWIENEVFAPITSIAYTTMLDYLWNAYWSTVTRNIIADSRAATKDEAFRVVNLAQASNRICHELLGNYLWWITTDANWGKILHAKPWGYLHSGLTVSENDILASFEMEPTNTDVRNKIRIYGSQGSDLDLFFPDYGQAEDATSQAWFGVREWWAPSVADSENERLSDRADAELRQRAYLRWRARFDIRDFQLEPGEGVTLSLPTIGVDGVALNDQYVVMQTVDHYSRGRATRGLLVVEKVPPPTGDPE